MRGVWHEVGGMRCVACAPPPIDNSPAPQERCVAQWQLPVAGGVASLAWHPADDTLALACDALLVVWQHCTSPNPPAPRLIFTPSSHEKVR
jgi:hypothetical protein